MTREEVLMLADCIRNEANSCNEYAKLDTLTEKQREMFYTRAGLLYSLERIARTFLVAFYRDKTEAIL